MTEIRPLREVVEQLIREALLQTYWDTGKAAKLLGISRKHVYNKMRHFGITREEICSALAERKRQQRLPFKPL